MPREKNPATPTVRKRAPRKTVAAATGETKPTLTHFVGPEQRAALIAEAAFFRAEKRGFAPGPRNGRLAGGRSRGGRQADVRETAGYASPNQSTSSQTSAAQGVSLRGMTAPTPEVLALLEATFDAVVIMDDRGRIEAFNASAEEMFGYRAADALGRNVNMLMTAADRVGARRSPRSATWRAAKRVCWARVATCAYGIATAANSRCS